MEPQSQRAEELTKAEDREKACFPVIVLRAIDEKSISTAETADNINNDFRLLI